ncbi:Putative phospholipid-transporting ATPase VA [Myotis brandtii]|uniref:Putative phospholipid-transporting ATPase VA n=1 Tax=Myotis brandtii TaxID=109478 RepID=S7N6G7_MYOBR|nr:Putative phospholipid-transporting ATPase VA [Myotis brandtii]
MAEHRPMNQEVTVRFQVGAHARVTGSIPSVGRAGGSRSVILSHHWGHGVWVRRYQEKKALFDVPEADGGSLSPVTAAVYSFLTMIIVLQVLIPVSLYVSIEIVKVCQVYFINQDVDLYDEETDSQLQCRALNITEDLGQIRYIFSDKTGTLTENKMVFRRCTVSGMEYSHDANGEPREKDITPDPKLLEKVSECDRCLAVARHQQHPLARLSPELSDVFDFFIALTICNTVVVTAPDQPRQKTPRRQPSGARIGGRVGGDRRGRGPTRRPPRLRLPAPYRREDRTGRGPGLGDQDRGTGPLDGDPGVTSQLSRLSLVQKRFFGVWECYLHI